MPLEKHLGLFVDKLFSLSKEKLYFLGILLLGIFMRLIASINLSDSADSMHFVTHAINFLSAGRLTTYDQSAGLWHALTSIFYNLFGATHFASTLASLIFGSASIVAIYLLAKEFFSNKVSLLAAFLLAIAPFHLKNTNPEMDVMALFFTLCAMLFFVKATKNEKSIFYILSGIFFGLGIYTKVYPLLFIPSMLAYQGYINYKKSQKIFLPKQIKPILFFLICIFIFSVPALAHNYLLYREKGIADFIFTNTLGIAKEKAQQIYGFDPNFAKPHDWKGFFFGNASPQHVGTDTRPIFIIILETLFYASPLIILLGFLGLFATLLVKRYRNSYLHYSLFFLFSIMFIFPFLGSTIVLAKHYLFLEILLIPLASLALSGLVNKVSGVVKHDITLIAGLVIFLATLIFLGALSPGSFPHFYGKSYVTSMIEIKEDLIPKNALVIADSRIYRGQVYWMLYGRPYLEAAEFTQIYSSQKELPGQVVNVETYYIECIIDDCGWGSIKDQPALNQSMEAVSEAFRNISQLVASISEPDRTKPYYPFKGNKVEILRVYKAVIPMKESIPQTASQPRNWFLHYVGYPDPAKEFDYYSPSGFNALINKLAHLIVLLAVFLALIAPLFLLYYLITFD